jgi:hypothetical protein
MLAAALLDQRYVDSGSIFKYHEVLVDGFI